MELLSARPTTAGPVVLIVDDDYDTRELYLAALPFFGCVVATAPDVDGAFDRACREHPDVIVTDVIMAQGDPWMLIRHLKQTPPTAAIPIVVLTGHGAQGLPGRARSEGCSAFLMKPCLPEQLFAELQRVLARSESDPGASP